MSGDISFGNGKESRLLLGLLREVGTEPRLCTGGSRHQADELDVEMSTLLQPSTSERVFPGFMSGAAHYYYGGTLAESHLRRPWPRNYDRASPQGQREFTGLLHSLGVDLTVHGPLTVLPPNLGRKILALRYPDLFAHQRSLNIRESRSEKHLVVSLLQLYHGIDVSSHCRPSLFREMARRFIDHHRAHPEDIGYHGNREIHRHEVRALLWRLRDHPFLSDVRSHIRPEWDGRWIDHVHRYVHPDVDPALLSIFHEYATDYDPRPDEFRIATPEPV